jgi:hypothetical protein
MTHKAQASPYVVRSYLKSSGVLWSNQANTYIQAQASPHHSHLHDSSFRIIYQDVLEDTMDSNLGSLPLYGHPPIRWVSPMGCMSLLFIVEHVQPIRSILVALMRLVVHLVFHLTLSI